MIAPVLRALCSDQHCRMATIVSVVAGSLSVLKTPAFLALAAALLQSQTQSPTFKARVDLVQVDAVTQYKTLQDARMLGAGDARR